MARKKLTFKCIILSPKKLLYEKEVSSVFCMGDQGEFEILAYHYPILGLLTKGEIVINQKEFIPVKGGVVRFFANECIIMIEEEEIQVHQKQEAMNK